jgi:Cdc6-like AAA superfamily ATPase
MVKYKVNRLDDSQKFITTQAYNKLYILLKKLKTHRGRIIHVIGAPGTGKSANIYQAINKLELDVYETGLILDNRDESARDVYYEFFKTLKEGLHVKNNSELFKKAAEYDALLWADKFHDYHLLDEEKVGFSQWMNYKGLKSFPFYFILILYYFRHFPKFKRVNLIFQTAWTFHFRGVKYDLFTDIGLFSKFLISFLMIFFEVVEISYTESEIIEIVKKHTPEAKESEIKNYNRRYGNKIRLILQSLKEDYKN